MKKYTLIIFILLSVSCSKKIMVSSSELETKMKMESEKARIEQNEKKVLFLIIGIVYGVVMTNFALKY